MARPSEELKKLQSTGNCESDAVKSWNRIFIYRKACEVLAMPFGERAGEIEKYLLLDDLKEEIIRVNEIRRHRGI